MPSMTLVIQGLPPDNDGLLPWEYPGFTDELVDVGLTLNGTAELSFPMQLDRLRWSLDLHLPQLDQIPVDIRLIRPAVEGVAGYTAALIFQGMFHDVVRQIIGAVG